MLSFERTLLFLTGIPFLGSLFFGTMFLLPAVSILIQGWFMYAAVTLALSVIVVILLGSVIDKIPDRWFVALVMISANVGGITCGLISGFTGGIVIICLQWLVYFIVTVDSITNIHNDFRIVVQHKDEMYEECNRIEKSKNKS